MDAINGDVCGFDWRCSAVLEDVKEMAGIILDLSMKFVHRSANMAADYEEMCPLD